jgi:hypothetical protein
MMASLMAATSSADFSDLITKKGGNGKA